jgi:hypothetical protein
MQIIDNGGNDDFNHLSMSLTNAQLNGNSNNNSNDNNTSITENIIGYGAALANTLYHDYGSNVAKFVYGVVVTGPKNLYLGTGELIYNTGVTIGNVYDNPSREFDHAVNFIGDTSMAIVGIPINFVNDPSGSLSRLATDTSNLGNYVLDNPEQIGALYFEVSAGLITGKAPTSGWNNFFSVADTFNDVGRVGNNVNRLYHATNSMLETLKNGGRIEIPPGTIGIRTFMSDAAIDNREILLFRAKDGKRYVVMGPEVKPKTLPSVRLPADTLRPIAHTHPFGGFVLSEKDIITLKDRGMKSHVIIDSSINRAVRLPVK